MSSSSSSATVAEVEASPAPGSSEWPFPERKFLEARLPNEMVSCGVESALELGLDLAASIGIIISKFEAGEEGGSLRGEEARDSARPRQ
jgi:hypothetical protein